MNIYTTVNIIHQYIYIKHVRPYTNQHMVNTATKEYSYTANKQTNILIHKYTHTNVSTTNAYIIDTENTLTPNVHIASTLSLKYTGNKHFDR